MSISKQFISHGECRKELFGGIQKMYDFVSATLGPHGRTILIEKVAHTMEATKDGVTVANDVYSPKKWEDMGMQLVREASQKANVMAGDATTTAIILAYWMCKEGLSAVANRANVYQVSRGMKRAVEISVKKLDKIARAIDKEEDYRRVATISTQDEEIGKLIASTFMQAGLCGNIDIQRQEEDGITVEKTEGLSFDKGWGDSGIFRCYINDRTNKKGMRCLQEDIPVLVVEQKIDHENQLFPIMEMLAWPTPDRATMSQADYEALLEERKKSGWPYNTRKLLVISDTFGAGAMGCLVANNSKDPNTGHKYFHLIFSKAPSYGIHKIETMKDICAITGAEFISEEHGGRRVEYATLKDLGRAKRIIVEEDKTIIIADEKTDRQSAIQERIEFIQNYLKDMPHDHIERKEWELRLATLTDGISIIKVGAESENERHELVRRVDDGVRAVRSAREEGVTPGCGSALLQCAEDVQAMYSLAKNIDERRGMEIVYKALHAVSLRLLEVGFVEDFTMPKWKRIFITPEKQRKNLVEAMKWNMQTGLIPHCGYNFALDQLDNMETLGVLDAKKAVRVALQAAVSVATTFLRIDGALGEISDETEMMQNIKRFVKE